MTRSRFGTSVRPAPCPGSGRFRPADGALEDTREPHRLDVPAFPPPGTNLLDLEEIRALLAVADTGSLLAGAERLGVPRSTLRRRLDELEAHAGVPLLRRNAQGALLTEAGERLAEGGRRLLQETRALFASVRDAPGEPAGVLRVSFPVGMPPQAYVPIFLSTRAAFPNLEIDAREFEDPLRALGEEFDVAFTLGGVIPEGPWVTRVLHRTREQLVGSVEYLERHGRPTSVAELGAHPLFAWRPPGLDPRLLPLADGTLVPMEPALVAADVHAVRRLATDGHGIAFIPHGGVPDVVSMVEPLEVVLAEQVGRECPFRVVVPETLSRSPKVQALQTMVLAFLA